MICTDCSAAVRDIIRDGESGLLVPPGDEALLAIAMARLMTDVSLRHRLGARARAVGERFSVTSVMEKWDHVIDDVGKRRAV